MSTGRADDLPRQAQTATPNVALYNLRDASGASQHDLAEALNKLARTRGNVASVTANQVSRWERGITRPSPFYRQLLAEHFKVSVDALSLSKPKSTNSLRAAPVAVEEGSGGGANDAQVALSQDRWRNTRRTLNSRRVQLAHRVISLYDDEHRLGHTGLLMSPDWTPTQPIKISAIRIEHDDSQPEPFFRGTEEVTKDVRPLVGIDRRFRRYSQAIRAVDHPRLFENRVAWCLQDLAWADTTGHMSFGDTTYFEAIDVCEAVAHETAASLIRPDGSLETPSWRSLPIRRQVGDPFDLSRRPMGTSINTLTLRQDRDGTTFVLHERNAASVAVAGGMLHVMPCGVFQPSSIRPAAQVADFDLWRNMMREYSEEFLGNPEHDGDGPPINYQAEPFAQFNRGLDLGKIRAFCLGVGLDALTLYAEILTVVVFDGDVYDAIFANMVDANDEGRLVKTGVVQPTPSMPFTEHTIRELIGSHRMAPAGAACLQLAWDSRRMVLDS